MSVPYDFYPAVLYAIDKISQGYTHTKACAEANISVATFNSYVRKDTQLQDMLMDADQQGYDAMADALLSPDNHLLYGQTNPQMAKVMSDNIKWVLARRDNKRFGDKMEVKHEFTMDRAITDAIDAARQRVHASTPIDVVDAEFEVLPPPAAPIAVQSEEDEAIMQELLGK